ncbi:MAG: hypothetical protein P1U65_12325 [Minwuia sp.]|nr:hypothetical protein [Minwuia sp.]
MKNRNRKFLVTTVIGFAFFALFSAAYAQGESLDDRVNAANSLTDSMIRACTLGQDVQIRVDASGSLSIFRRGVEGKFVASRKEIPSIIQFLQDDDRLIISQSAMECTSKYFGVIMDLVNINSPGEIRRPISLPFYEDDDLILKVVNCVNVSRSTKCRFSLSMKRNMRIAIKGDSRILNKLGSTYFASTIKIGNKSGSVHGKKRSYVYDDLFVGPNYDIGIIFDGKIDSGELTTVAIKVNSRSHFILNNVVVN